MEAMRGRRWDVGEVRQYQGQTEHLARLFVKTGDRGAKTIQEQSGADGWTEKWVGRRAWR